MPKKDIPRDHCQLMPHPYSSYCEVYNCVSPSAFQVGRPDGPGNMVLLLCEHHARQLAASIPDEFLPQLIDYRANLINQIKAQIEDDSITLKSALEIIGVPVPDGFWEDEDDDDGEYTAAEATAPEQQVAHQIQKQVGVIAFTPEIAERMIAALEGVDDELRGLLQIELDAVNAELASGNGIGDDGAPMTDKDTPPAKAYTCECGQTFDSPGAKGAHVKKCEVAQAAKAAKEGR
jgi:hypothetical protein